MERRARTAVRDQREQTARARDERTRLAGTLSRILLDALDGGEDPLARALREVGERTQPTDERPELRVGRDVREPLVERLPAALSPSHAARLSMNASSVF
ncbi:MAG: hypothetical protein ACLP01_18510 [Solirubrobacteraceae bacterium]